MMALGQCVFPIDKSMLQVNQKNFFFIHLSPCLLHSADMGVSSCTLSPFNQSDSSKNTISQCVSAVKFKTALLSAVSCLFQAFMPSSSTPSSSSSSSSGSVLLAGINLPCHQMTRILFPPSPPQVSGLHLGVSCFGHRFITSPNMT